MTNSKGIMAVAGILVVSFSAIASAADLSGRSRTYLQAQQLIDDTQLTGLYEYLDLRTDGTGSETVSFAAGGWYRYYLQSSGPGSKDTGDLQYAYLTLRKKTANASLNLGRVAVAEGVVYSQLDGASARTDLRGGFTVSAFGGIPLETDQDTRSGDSVYGGRIGQGVPGIYTIGASYLKEKNDSKDYRKEEGFDIWLRPVGKLELMGTSAYNAETKNWMQHQYYLMLGPLAMVRVNLEASKTWYKEYFATATVSAFASPFLDPNEVVTVLGGSAVIAASSSFSVVADYRTYDYQVLNGTASYYGGSVAYTGKQVGAGAGYHVMDGPTAALQYDEQRVYVTAKIAKVDVTLDAMHIGYEQAINNETDAWNISAALGYTFTPKLRVVADAEYATNPDFDSDVRGMLSLVYSFDFPLASKPKPGSTPKPGAAPPKGKKG
jgi:hypothetical protein